jgi:ribonuclease HI
VTEQPDKVFFDSSTPEKFFLIGSNLSPADRECLLRVLIDNQDIFAWSVYDAPGVSSDLASHSLNIKPEHRPVVQKRRKLAPERATIVLEEVERLLASGAIREVQYPAWLSNTVVVRKKNGKWRVCIDFTDLNKACPKDPFPLPRIDQLVDSASRHARLSFLDAFQGYHQIPMNPADQEKTAFITPRGTYCYRVMPFGLKNAGATYQRMVTKMFGPMLGKTVEVYIDDMLVKSLREEDHIADLLQVFNILRRDNLRLNASKCTFGVGSGKFLGHIVSRRGIEANPDQIAALINLAEPRNIKQVQRLTGMIAALGRFISRSADKCKPFFRLLGKRSRFEWDEECSVAFQAIKAYLSTPPCLSIPNPGEPLFLYLAVSDHAVSAVLVRESTQDQRPVFFVSKTMDEAELRYLPLEKAALALLYAAKKLPHYFQSSTVTVLSDLPLKMLLQRSDFTGRITRWGVYLGSLGVEYKPRTAIKGQVLAEFLAEFQYDPSNPTLFNPAQTDFNSDKVEWKLFVDGASNSKGSGAGIVLISPEGLVLEQAVRLKFSASNNEAEYEAMLIGLRTAKKLGAGNLQIFCDSQLVANQISGEYQARDDRMSAYLTVARTLLSEFDSTHVAQIGREHNSHADVLAKLATALESDMQRTVCIETLEQPSFQDQEVSVCSVNVRPSWMDPLLGYIRDNRLPEDKKEARMIKQKAPRFWVSEEGQLYRRSFTGPYLLCVHPDKVKDFLFEIHEGICGSHTGGRSLAHRALSQGYWWPYMQADALKYVQECDKCQRFAPMIHQPARELNPLSSPWPFAQWGLDIVGPLPRAPGNKKFLITATDYFTKWIEAEPLSNIRDVDTKRFLWKSIITRFGIPWAVISDNGTQFESKLFKGFCSDLGIRNFFSSPGYPQSNGQAEISNKVVLSGIKRKLEAAKGKWVEELPSVLWTYRTTVRRSTNETPFALAFGVEAVIPLEIGMPTIRTTEFTVQTNEERLGKDLDLVEEKRNLAVVRLAAYQQQMRREHNKNVKPRTFRAGDLVLRKVMANTRRPNDGKLGPNWEGPYKVLSQTGHGAYRLEDLDGKPIPRPWNTCNLRKYFF